MIVTASMVQRKILQYIQDYTQEHGYPPVVTEIMPAAGYTSTSSVHHQLGVLEARKLITRMTPPGARARSARTIVVTDKGREAIATGRSEVLL